LTNFEHKCKKFADKYIEHDFVVLFIDIILIKPQVYRHLLYNRLGTADGRLNVLPPGSWLIVAIDSTTWLITDSVRCIPHLGTCRKVFITLYSSTSSARSLCLFNTFQNFLSRKIVYPSRLRSNKITIRWKSFNLTVLVLSCVVCCGDCWTSYVCSLGC
jgi:hypothetical protein